MLAPWSPVAIQMREMAPPGSHPLSKFRRLVQDHITTDSRVVDLGCGQGAKELVKMGGACRIGIDLAPLASGVLGAHLLQADGSRLPLANGSVDVVYSRAVVEHLPDPGAVFCEVARVLRGGGLYFVATPNLWDYASIAAWLLPNRLHPWLVSRVAGRAEESVFPTLYRANTVRALRRHAAGAGLEIILIEYLGQYPAYLTFNRALFWLGCLYEQALRYERLKFLRGWLIAVLRKPAGDCSSKAAINRRHVHCTADHASHQLVTSGQDGGPKSDHEQFSVATGRRRIAAGFQSNDG